MYNGIGLQTPRGSGTNGYIQSNKFFVRPKTGKDGASGKGGFGADQGTGGISKKPNRDILEHDRKRQIQLKLVVLEDKLIEQGYTEAEISDKLEETRMNLEAAAASADDGGPTAITKVSDTQTHQIAARKEKKMEALRAALGITTSEPDNQKKQSETPYSDSEEGEIDQKPRNILKKSHNDDDMLHDKDAQGEKDDRKKDKERKNDAERDGHDKSRSKTQESKRRGHNDDSSDTDSGTKQVQGTKKKHLKSGRHSDSDSDSDIDVLKKTMQKSTRKQKQSRRHDSDDSDSDDGEKYEKARKRHASDDDGSSSDEQRNRKTQKGRRDSKLRRRHDSEDESDSDSGEKIRRNEVEGKKNAHRESHRTEKEKSLSYEQTKMVNARHEKTGRRYHVEGDSDSDRARKDKKGKVEKSRKGQHDTNEVDPDTGYDKKFEKTRKSKRHDTDEDDSDTGYDKKIEKTRKSRRHDTHEDDSDTGNGKKIEKTQKSRRHDTDEDDSDDSKSDVSYGRSFVSDSDSDGYGYKKIDKSKLEKKNRGGNGNDLSKHESSREEKSLLTSAVGNDDKRNKRSGINNASDGLDALKKLEELYQSRRETEGGSRYSGHETMRGKRKVEDENQDEQPESKSRRRNVEREAEHKKVESETKSISYKDRDDQRKDDYPRLNKSGGGHDVENIERGARVHGRSELPLDNRRGDRNRNEDELRERKHTRDEGEIYGRHGRDEDQQHGSRRRVREEEEEERGGRRDERGRQLDSSKRVKYDDYRSSERRRYDNDKRDDGRPRR